MAYIVTVLYNTLAEGDFFDMDYYLNTHMPLVQKTWSQDGLKSWQVLQCPPDGPFYGGAVLTWEKAEGAAKSLAAEKTKPVFDDVPNFTNLTPIVITSPVISSWVNKEGSAE
ncbi:hypothetical protein V8C35DRAFT_298544 [Trichoderma chlorosporum]